METKINTLELELSDNHISSKSYVNYQETNDKIIKDGELIEISYFSDQIEFQFCPFLPKERKISNDSSSICASQAETLSQTSESSFFLSHTAVNSQQKEKNEENNIPFYYGVKEYFLKTSSEKFTEYTTTKNYIHKNVYFKPKHKKEKCKQDYTSINYYYFPVVYCPKNSLYFNHFPKVIINSYNNNKTQKENVKVNEKDKNKKHDEAQENSKDTDKDKEEEKFIEENKEQKKEITKEENIPVYNKKDSLNKNIFNYNNNYRRNKYYNNKKLYYNNQRYTKNNNRYYNKYTKFNYYNDNYFQSGTTSYYNNSYYKRKNQNHFENKYYYYK